MAIQAEIASVQECYVRETELRMKLLVRELQALVQSKSCCTDTLWCQVREQEEASEQAGFDAIARLCRQMRACLQEAIEGVQTPLPIAARAMLAVCRAIEMHALDVDKRIHHAHGSDAFGKSHTMAGNSAKPYATFSSPYVSGRGCTVETE